MKITLVGTGISQGIPVIGCRCAACQSSNPRDKRLRTAAVVSAGKTQIALDIGPDFRAQMIANHVAHLDAVLVTHEHSDHIAGLDDIRPYNWIAQGHDIPFYAEARVLDALKLRFPYAFVEFGKRYPGAPGIKECIIDQRFAPFSIGEIRVEPFRVIHGKLPIVGYRLGRLAYITDASDLPDTSYARLEGLDVLVINALRHTPHASHFSLDEALRAIERIQPRRAYLTHISHEMGCVDDFQQSLPANVFAGYDGQIIEIDRD